MEHLLFYDKRIDTKVAQAVEQVLGVDVIKVVKLKRGEVNHVYKVITIQKDLLVRVFKNKYWPEDGKWQWIEKQLTKHSIAHARIVHYTRDAKFFSFGFMITEFLAGYDGTTAVEKRKITLAQAYENIGKTLKRVHAIKVEKYGHLNNGKGMYKNFVQGRLQKDVQERFEKIRDTRAFPESLIPVIEERLRKCLSQYSRRFYPVLNHGDPNRENAILTTDHRWVLIDWDNAFASIWLEDFADVSFWIRFMHDKTKASRRYSVYKKNFFKGYGKSDFTWKEIQQIEHGLHIIKCMKLLPYYYSNKQNMKDFHRTKKMLLELLNNKKFNS